MTKFYRKSVLRRVKETWGKEEKQEIPFRNLEENFVSMLKKEDWMLDDQAWNDLEMNQVFQRLNRTYSGPGRQCLYNMLRILRFDEEELKRRDRVIEFFRINPEPREALCCLFDYIDKEDYDGMASMLFHRGRVLPACRQWVYPCTIGMMLSIVTIPFTKWWAVFLILGFFIANSMLNHRMSLEMDAALSGVRSIGRLLGAAKEVSHLNFPELEEYNGFFRKSTEKCRVLMKKMRGLGIKGEDPLGLSEYMKAMFLSDARGILRCMKEIEENQATLRGLYRRMGELDAFQSMAAVRKHMHHWCKPAFVDRPNFLRAKNMGHLLLRQPVCNSITMDQNNVVITGSNMSGKSTFLRTVGLNAILAQTFYTVLAKEYETSFFTLMTSISPDDNLMEGTSYYMAEAETLLRMLQVLDPKQSALLIVDEIFRGTNPTERVAAASAMLTYLAKKNCLAIVATHDIQIIKHAQDKFACYHFTENVTQEELQFDYKLREGVNRQPNGIRILEYLGYPEEILEQAKAQVEATVHEDI